jgi:REP element-mobilizing transposase RayT
LNIQAGQLYHIYNQGNNQEVLFKSKENYLLFLKIYKEKVEPFAELISYCLMPNHFHFLINVNEHAVDKVMLGSVQSTKLGNGFRLLCSSYANEFNKQNNRTGSLFRQKTKAKCLDSKTNYALICFHYIHQNPMLAGLCDKMEDWEFSSFRDYCGLRNIGNSLINKSLAFDLALVSDDRFYEESYEVIGDDFISKLY